MDLEVVGRHALLFDDDATASFVNSGEALVDWHSLQIDRYDVRHLLSAPLPPRRRGRNPQSLLSIDPVLESQLDYERYLDLPSYPDQPESEEDEKPMNSDGYRAVAFSYGNADDSAEQTNVDAGLESSRFCPSFPVPESLSQSLPPTEKLHQIIARTAMFVYRHGGQSEIVLRVKQGDNPTFGFLMPDHHLHAYFRYLVDHPELLHSDVDERSQNEGKKAGGEQSDPDGIGGALSLLGSVYGSGEEEDADDSVDTRKEVPGRTAIVDKTISRGLEKKESSEDATYRDDSGSKNPLTNKGKVHAVKKNSLLSASRAGNSSAIKKRVDSGSFSVAAEKSKDSALGVTSRVEPIVLDPPSDMKRLVDKIVELIMKHGDRFVDTLVEQDSNQERFPFLLPSNPYHPYYLKVLQKARESKINGKGFQFGKDDLVGRGMDKKASVLRKGDSSLSGCDTFEFDRKEKFKMILGKSKKDAQETEWTGTQQEFGVTVDAAAAAAILQAARRGIRTPNLGIISSTSQNVNNGHSSEDNQASTSRTLPISQLNGIIEKSDQNGGDDVSDPVTKTNARTTSVETTGEAHSSETNLTKEQKLKAERLKRAKMFVAMLKSGNVPFKTDTLRGSSVERQESGISKFEGEDLSGKQLEGSSAPIDVDKLATDEQPEKNNFGEENNEQISKRKYRSRSGEHMDEDDIDDDEGKKAHKEVHSKRKYRSRSGRNEDEDEDENGDEREMKRKRKKHRSHSSPEDGENGEEERDHRHSKKKHRSHRSRQVEDDYEDRDREEKDRKRSRKKHQAHHSSREHSRKRHSSKKYSREEEDEDEERHHRHWGKKHHSHRSSHHSRHSRRHKEKSSSNDRESRDYTKDDGSSDSEYQQHISHKHKMERYEGREGLEEGEISSKASGDSKGNANGHVSREASLEVSNTFQRAPSQLSETTEVSDELRAKIRAMLLATR